MKRKQIALLLSLLLSVSPVAESAAVWGADFTDGTAVEQTQEEETGKTGNQAADEEETAEEVSDFASEEISFSAGEEQNAEVTAFSDEDGGNNESRYEVGVNYSTGSAEMYPGQMVTIGVDLWQKYTDENGNEQNKKFEGDYQIKLEGDPEIYNSFATAEVSADGKSLVVTAKDKDQLDSDADNSGDIPISIFINGEEVAKEKVWISVTDSYYIIKMNENLENGEVTVGLGDELDLSLYDIKTVYYDADHRDGEEDRDFSYEVTYDENVWDEIEKKENGLPVLQRNENEPAKFEITAWKLLDEESGERREIRTQFWIDGLDYSTDLEFSYGSRDEDVFLYGEKAKPLTLTVVPADGNENDMTGFSVDWEVNQYVDNDDDESLIPADCVKYTSDSSDSGILNDKITLKAKEGYNFANKNLRLQVTATIRKNGKEASVTGTSLWVREAVENIEFPKDRTLLPGNGMRINATYNGWKRDEENLWQRDIRAHVIDVSVDGLEDVLDVNSDDEGNYYLDVKRNGKGGKACVILTYYITESEDGEKTGEPKTYSFYVSVQDESYSVDYSYSSEMSEDFGVILPNTEAVVTTSLYKQTYDIEEDIQTQTEVKDYQMELVYEEDNTPAWDDDLVEVTIVEGNKLRIKAKNRSGETEIPVNFVVNGETVVTENIRINVQENICYISPGELTDEDGNRLNVNVGESLDLSNCGIKTWFMDSTTGKKEEASKDEIRYLVEYDENQWSVIDSGKNGLPILRRKTIWEASIDISVETKHWNDEENKWEWEVSNTRNYVFSDVSCNLNFAYSYGNESDCVYTDKGLSLTLETEELNLSEDAYKIEWNVYRYNDKGERISASDIVNSSEESGTKLNLTGIKGHNDEAFWVEAVVKVDGQEVGGCENQFWVQEPVRYLINEDSYQQILNTSNSYAFYDKNDSGKIWMELYEKNGEYPNGKRTDVKVADIEVLNTSVLEKVEKEDRTELRPLKLGETEVVFSLEDKDGKKLDPVTITIAVVENINWIESESELEGRSGTGELLPGESLKVKMTVVSRTIDEDGETIKTLTEGEDYRLEYDYDDEMISVDEKGTVTAKTERRGDTWLGIRVIDCKTGEQIGYQGVNISVTGRYYVIEPKETEQIYVQSDGKEQTISLSAIAYGIKNQDGVQDIDGTFMAPSVASDLFNISVKDNSIFTVSVKTDSSSAALKPGEVKKVDVPVIYLKNGNMVAETSYTVVYCNHIAKETGRVWPSCSSGGYVNYKCETCGYTWQETLGAYGHSWDNGVVTKEATCTTAGTKTYTCKDCRSTYTETIKATGEHKWDEGVITKEATCTEDGVKTYTCTVCKETKTETIKAEDAHKWDEGVITKEATCTEDGVKTYTCTLCKKTRTETIKSTNEHQWDKGVITKKATCTKDGVRTYTCSVCHTEKTETIPALKHKWSAWKTKSAATALKAKVQERTCSTCKKTQTRTTGEKLTPKATLNVKSLKLKKKQKTTAFKITGMAKGDYVKSWKSSDTNVVKVSGKKDGTCTITAQKQAGTATITITFASGLVKTLKVKVQASTVKTTAISNIAEKATLKKGKTLELKPVLEPITSGEEITYESSDPTIAKVSKKGVVTALKPGTVTITIKSGKLTVTCKITVKK